MSRHASSIPIPPPNNRLDLHVSLGVDLRAFEHWPPATLNAFLRGVASCISADSVGRALPEGGRDG